MNPHAGKGSILALWCTCLGALPVLAGTGYGPEQVTIQATIDTEKVAKPAFLPHHKHQWLDCDGCHHTKGADGKKVDWVSGQEIATCESCHNTKAGRQEQLATLKKAAHKLCMECHLRNDKELARCGVCHTRQ